MSQRPCFFASQIQRSSSIHWSVIKGETQTGVCTMQMDEGMDTGDVLLSQATPISVETTTGEV